MLCCVLLLRELELLIQDRGFCRLPFRKNDVNNVIAAALTNSKILKLSPLGFSILGPEF